jgi:hypothetical protein
MQKVPVFETIAHAYGFAFGRFFQILGIVWAPTVILLAVTLLSNPFFFHHDAISDPDSLARMSLRMAPLTLAVTLIARSMMAAGVTELALGTHKGPSFVYFSLGGAVWRFLGAWLLTILVIFVLVIGLAIAMAIAGVIVSIAFNAGNAGGAGLSKAAIGGLVGLGVLFFYAVLIYVTVRLTVFIPPLVVAEGEVNLARGWQLTKGNFWRIFAVGLGIFIPLTIVILALLLIVYGSLFAQYFSTIMADMNTHAGPDAVQKSVEDFQMKMSAAALGAFPYTAVFGLLSSVFVYGLSYGASVFAYRAVTDASSGEGMRGTMA